MPQNLLGIASRYATEIDKRDLAIHLTGYLRHLKNTAGPFNHSNYPTIIALEITYNCGRRCKDCYVPNAVKKDDALMDEGLFRKVLAESKKHSVIYTGIVGGEPISKDTIPLIVSVLKDNPLRPCSTYSNGDYIAENGLQELSELHNIAYSTSVDGFGESHDAIRGKGSFENVIRTFRNSLQARKLFGAAVTLRRETRDELTSRPFLEFLSDEHVKYVQVMKLKTEDEHNITPEEFTESINRLGSISKDFPMFITFGAFGDSQAYSPEFRYRQMFVSPTGHVRIKKGLTMHPIGNFKTQDLEQILRNVN